MEYSLLKLISPPLPYLHSNRFIRLSSTPAKDLVNPGIGQSVRLFSFYVPLTYNNNPYKITKVDTQELKEQEGFGTVDLSSDDNNLDDQKSYDMTSVSNETINDDTNSTKEENQNQDLSVKDTEKDLSPGIRASFEFPKIKIKKTIIKSKPTKKNALVKHKFNIV